jgi:hypothetical protein
MKKVRWIAMLAVVAVSLLMLVGGGASAHHRDIHHGACDNPTIPLNGNEGGVVRGTNGDDVYRAQRGQPTTFFGLRGDDRFCGNKGQDTFYGGRGFDQGWGGHGSDRLFGQRGPRDFMNGNSGGGDRCVAEREVNCER